MFNHIFSDKIKGKLYTFREDNSVKIDFVRFWKGSYSVKKVLALGGGIFFC